MMSTRETATRDKEEGAEVEEGREKRATGFAGAASVGSARSRFVASCAALQRIDSLLMAPMT